MEQIYKFPHQPQKETLALEGYGTPGSLFDIYLSMETLYQHLLRTQIQLVEQSQHLNHSFQLAQEKINKYYFFKELSPMICASLVLQLNMDNFTDDCELG